ncbi:hypothetical protein DL96DRAFT_1720163 [Flagelloscypha sp. PMI_526]|nr:hypothetical protein DL96DRAFT_1720163 [Flagelloscypha sp. PMI_526]
MTSHFPPPPRPPPAPSGDGETGPLPLTKLPFPPPVPDSNIQATSVGQEESLIENDNRPLIKRDVLPLWNTATTTGTGSLTPLWKGFAWTVRLVDHIG